MVANNAKLLTDSQLAKFNDKYIFTFDEDFIIVSYTTSKKRTRHSTLCSFSILARDIGRKITITPKAMEIYKTLLNCKIKDYTLIDVQQAINTLNLCFRTINFENVLQLLKQHGMQVKIKK